MDDELHADETSEAERLVQSELAALGIVHERVPCDPALADTAAFCSHYGFALTDSANAILVAAKKPAGRNAACLLLADSRLDVNRTVCGLLGAKRASFASAEDTRALTRQLIGGVSVFGLPPELPIYIDARVMGRERIILGGGSRSWKLILAPAELRKIGRAEIIEGLAQPIAP